MRASPYWDISHCEDAVLKYLLKGENAKRHHLEIDDTTTKGKYWTSQDTDKPLTCIIKENVVALVATVTPIIICKAAVRGGVVSAEGRLLVLLLTSSGAGKWWL